MRVSDLLYVAGIGLSTANQGEDYEPPPIDWSCLWHLLICRYTSSKSIGGEDNCLGKKWDIAFRKGKYIFGGPSNYCLSTDMVRIAH